MGPARRAFNAALVPAIRLGIAPLGLHLLTTVGRKSGLRRTHPVQVLKDGGDRFLIAPYGSVSWVHNARASGVVELARGRRTEELAVEETSPERAGSILKRYVKRAPVVLPYFKAGATASVEEFAAEAHLHPVFRLVRKD